MYFTMLILVAITATCWESAVVSAVETSTGTLAALVEASTAIEPAEDDDEVVATSFWHRDIHSSATLSEYGIPQCNSTGKFADPDDCGKYYECVPNHNGGFVARQKSCFGHAFHPTLQTCAPLRMVEGCIPRSLRIDPDPDPDIQGLCNNAENEFFCLDCKTLIMCVGNVAYLKPCGSGRVCNNYTSSFKGGVCYPGKPVNCTCDKDYIFRQDIYDESKFLTCDVAGSDPTIYRCPEGLVFNEECAACADKNEETCTAKGPYTVNKDCTGYLTYVATFQGWVDIDFTCKSKTMFNERTGKCENPCYWFIDDFTCKEEGRFANKGDCKKYHECIYDPSNDKLIKVEQHCPEGFEWGRIEDEDLDHCVTNATSTEECLPQRMPDNCVIPDWCTTVWCNSSCMNGGTCIGPDHCTCTDSWEGKTCEMPICNSPCENGGTCSGPNTCTCTDSWKGSTCNEIQCSEAQGFFKLSGSNQCMKVFQGLQLNWAEADAKCNSEELALAKPDDPKMVAIYLRDNYNGPHGVWVGGYATGSGFVWQDGLELSLSSPLWYPAHPGDKITTDWCLGLAASPDAVQNYADTPYFAVRCTDTYPAILCEEIMD